MISPTLEMTKARISIIPSDWDESVAAINLIIFETRTGPVNSKHVWIRARICERMTRDLIALKCVL